MFVTARHSVRALAATATASAVVLGMMTLPPDRLDVLPVGVEHRLVQHDVMMTSAVLNTAAAVVSAESSAKPSPGPSPTAAATAAATGPAEIVKTIARGVLTAVGVVALPFWWLAFPITMPLTWSIVNTVYPIAVKEGDYGISGFQQAFAFAFGWGFGPLALVFFAFPPTTPETPAPAQAVARAVATAPTADTTVEPAPADRATRDRSQRRGRATARSEELKSAGPARAARVAEPSGGTQKRAHQRGADRAAAPAASKARGGNPGAVRLSSDEGR